ncbi:cysteine methyltransferase [Bacillaceae bacterium SAOS 7]|nr:cysteine methyltransferase [Bacillaceae bacterium SAOS 7]
MTKNYKVDYKSPIGIIEIISTDEVIRSIMFSERDKKETLRSAEVDLPLVLKECYKQLDEYFNGYRQQFTFPYEYEGTNFQKTVWDALTKIPYAKRVSYMDIATAIGNEKAVRAVGSSNGRNKLSIVIPCHRVIGSTGKLTGYAGGLWRKEWLLQHEKSIKSKHS